MKVNFDLDDLTNAALKRMVKQLIAASDSEEKKILKRLASKDNNDLADLDEEMHGRPKTPKVEDDGDAFDLEAKGDDDEASDTDSLPKKRGRK